jgi:phosphonate degradation associated HDIG domain protein
LSNVDELLTLLTARGDSQYGGERVTQLQHALQCAALAEQDHASPPLIVAALLHDVGHLLHALPDQAPDDGIDDRHESAGCHYLQSMMPAEVTEPVALHVPAKRYLCAVEPHYLATLSPPSVVSLHLQGGPMSEEEVRDFRQNRFADDAVRLRRWDDDAKVVDRNTPTLEHFAALVHTVALPDRKS